MTYITDIQELRKAERSAKPKEVNALGESVQEFLARGGAIVVVPFGVGSETPIIPSKQPDGSFKNDYASQEASRKRTSKKNNVSTLNKAGPSGRIYIRMRVTDKGHEFRCMIQNAVHSDWNTDIEVALKVRDNILIKRGQTIPD